MEVSMRRHGIFHAAVFSILAVLAMECWARGKPQEKEKPLGVVCAISELFGKSSSSRLPATTPFATGKSADIIELIMSSVRAEVWRAKDSAHAIFELHGKKLEI